MDTGKRLKIWRRIRLEPYGQQITEKREKKPQEHGKKII